MPQLYALAPVEFNSAAPTCDCVAHRSGNAADHPERVRRYPSDMTDAEWAVVRPLLVGVRVKLHNLVRSYVHNPVRFALSACVGFAGRRG